MNTTNAPYPKLNKKEHILVCLSPTGANQKVIRTAASMAKAYNGNFTAIFVQTPSYEKLDGKIKSQLSSNIALAQGLGAEVNTVYGDDTAFQIAEYARLSAVTKIVIGKATAHGKSLFKKTDLAQQIADRVNDIEIHTIPVEDKAVSYPKNSIYNTGISLSKEDLVKTFAVLAFTTAIGVLFDVMNINEANIITVYILGVLVTAISTKGQFYSILSALISVPLFDFLFTSPRYTFHVDGSGYPVTFVLMLTVSFITGTLATRLKQNAAQSAQSAYRTKILFDTSQLLKNVRDEKEIMAICAGQIHKLLDRDTIAYTEEKGALGKGVTFTHRPDNSKNIFLFIAEEVAARWAFTNRKPRGVGTENIQDAKGTYLPVENGDEIYGIIGILADDSPLDLFRQSIVNSIIGECALAVENARNAREREVAAEKIKSEQLRSNLLRTISHDLRTPLTTISGNADNLISNYDKMEDEDIRQAFTDIYQDAQWLGSVVENILSVTRIEEGKLNFNMTDEIVEDVIYEALNHIGRKKTDHNITTHIPDEILMAKIDAKLIIQVIVNLVENALKYTPSKSNITIGLSKKGRMVFVSVADDGPGIPDHAKPYIFDMFYTANKKTADSRRSMGLGLSLCKSIINAHGGNITVTDNRPKGSIFTFSLPLSEVTIHE